MYTYYFGFKETPFSITPDPEFLFLSPHHQDALAHLFFGLKDQGGFVVLTGEVGTGKTTLIRTLLTQKPQDVDIALFLNPKLGERDFLAGLCDELNIATPVLANTKQLTDILNTALLKNHAQGRYTVIIVDEAQHISPSLLEQIRLLTNLETHKSRLLKVILVGQPELNELISRQELRQVAQRITGRYHLRQLLPHETIAYIQHRLAIAGATRVIFTAGALASVHRYTGGIPRLTNVLCDRALLGAYAQHQAQVEPKVIHQAAKELQLKPTRCKPCLLIAQIILLLLVVSLVYWFWQANGHAFAKPFVQEEKSSVDINTRLDHLLQADTVHIPLQYLMQLWQIKTMPTTELEPCDWLKQQHFTCTFQMTTLAEIRAIGLPVLLQIRDKQQTAHEALLIAQPDTTQTWRLVAAGGELVVSNALLAERWSGEAVFVWRPPAGQHQLGPGEQGAAVVALKQSLAYALNNSLTDGDQYNGEVMLAIQQFQQQRHLPSDGIANQLTLLHLAQANLPILSE